MTPATVLIVAEALVLVALVVLVLRTDARSRALRVRLPVDLERLAADIRRDAGLAVLSRDRLAGALAEFPDGVVVTDAAGEIVFRNPAAERYSQARHADALAEDAIRELLDRALDGEWGERELELFGPPQEVLNIRAVPVTNRDGILGAAAHVRDISEARRVESIRRDFVANVTHELKTPIGALTLLAETMASSDDVREMRRLAERVERESHRLGRIIDDLLDLSLVEAREAPTRESVPVEVLAAEAAGRVRSAAEKAAIRIEVQPVAPGVAVRCDRRQVLSALVNLLENAIKYSDPGSPVMLTTYVDGDRAVLSVEDRGIGIPGRDLERIFERFYRVDKARSRDTGGTGLGLSIVRHVAHAHGGDVMVESREGEGSTFRLTLPLVESHREPS